MTFPETPAFDPHKGLTKREYFAAMALQGLLANPERYKYVSALVAKGAVGGGLSQDQASAKNARKAVYLADALIVALNTKQ